MKSLVSNGCLLGLEDFNECDSRSSSESVRSGMSAPYVIGSTFRVWDGAGEVDLFVLCRLGGFSISSSRCSGLLFTEQAFRGASKIWSNSLSSLEHRLLSSSSILSIEASSSLSPSSMEMFPGSGNENRNPSFFSDSTEDPDTAPKDDFSSVAEAPFMFRFRGRSEEAKSSIMAGWTRHRTDAGIHSSRLLSESSSDFCVPRSACEGSGRVPRMPDRVRVTSWLGIISTRYSRR